VSLRCSISCLPSGHPRAQRGMSLVELMVGITVGLFVAAAAAMLTATQLGENRKLMLEAQIQQDLRATADIITRDLRRAGYWSFSFDGVWDPSKPDVSPLLNVEMQPFGPVAGPSSNVSYKYTRLGGRDNGFELQGTRIRTLLTMPAGFQDLTDASTLKVTGFTVTPRHAEEPLPGGGAPERLPCPKLCPDGSRDCWPTLRIRELQVDIAGQSTVDPSVSRSVRTIVRLRNDQILRTATDAAGNPLICPA